MHHHLKELLDRGHLTPKSLQTPNYDKRCSQQPTTKSIWPSILVWFKSTNLVPVTNQRWDLPINNFCCVINMVWLPAQDIHRRRRRRLYI